MMKPVLLAGVFLLLARVASAQEQQQCEGDDTCTTYQVPLECSLVLAKSPLDGWGIFTMDDKRRGAPVLSGDVVLQVPDVMNTVGMEFFEEDYWKSAEETGGMYEGKVVHSITPGVGMLSNSLHGKSNILPYRVDRDDGDCRRETCKSAGSFTHYHNYTWFVHKDLKAGQELLAPQSDEWFDEHDLLDDDDTPPPQRSIAWLRQHGICLDNIMPQQPTTSGRGAIATRFLPRHAVVAPVPVVPIFDWQISLKMNTKAGAAKQQWQLLLNYCYGHAQSSLMLFPYSPIVNLINHGDDPNVRLQWSQQHNRNDWLEMTLEELEDEADEPGLLLELVAIRDIVPGEAILLDYGADWKAAWDQHKLPTFDGMYTPAHVMDEVASKVRTETEQAEYPYVSNLMTSCFYDYQNKTSSSSGGITTIPWNMTRSVFEWRNLRPCSIIQRDDASSLYTVKMRNRQGLWKIPKMHLVSKVPRQAIRFSDKLYTTDQHLPQSFRHWIGIPEEIFPDKWRDKKNDEKRESIETY
jgi:hypothetical protein